MLSSPNSDDLNSTLTTLSNLPGLPTTQHITSSPESSLDVTSVDFKEAPLETLLLVQEKDLVHNMSPEQLTAYIQRCNLLRSSAQTRKAALTTEKSAPKTKKKVDNVNLALDFLKQIQTKKP